jgi:hypothetical protein
MPGAFKKTSFARSTKLRRKMSKIIPSSNRDPGALAIHQTTPGGSAKGSNHSATRAEPKPSTLGVKKNPPHNNIYKKLQVPNRSGRYLDQVQRQIGCSGGGSRERCLPAGRVLCAVSAGVGRGCWSAQGGCWGVAAAAAAAAVVSQSAAHHRALRTPLLQQLPAASGGM